MNTFKCSGKQNCTVRSGKLRYPEKKNRAIDEKDVRYKEGNLGNSE